MEGVAIDSTVPPISSEGKASGRAPEIYRLEFLVGDHILEHLQKTAERVGGDLSIAFLKAVGLHMMATDGIKDGKHLILTDQEVSDGIELVGF